jgi:hypothetical protein
MNSAHTPPLKKSYEYLEEQWQDSYPCLLSSSPDMTTNCVLAPQETASPLLVLGTALRYKRETTLRTLNQQLIQFCRDHMNQSRMNFFVDNTLLPDDTETTAYAWGTLIEANVVQRTSANTTLDEIVRTVNQDGIITTYFCPEARGKKNQQDHVSIANILYTLHLTHREENTIPSAQFVRQTLSQGTYLSGSRYYHSPDAFLYFLSRLAGFTAWKDMREPLKEHLKERIGTTIRPLDLAMRVTTAHRLGISAKKESGILVDLMDDDGSWPADAIYHYGSKTGYFGSRIISTAFAIEALARSVF